MTTEQESPEITKSWIFVNNEEIDVAVNSEEIDVAANSEIITETVQKNHDEESHLETDSDSISIISESENGSSLESRSDDDELISCCKSREDEEVEINKFRENDKVEVLQGSDIVEYNSSLHAIAIAKKQPTSSNIYCLYLCFGVIAIIFAVFSEKILDLSSSTYVDNNAHDLTTVETDNSILDKQSEFHNIYDQTSENKVEVKIEKKATLKTTKNVFKTNSECNLDNEYDDYNSIIRIQREKDINKNVQLCNKNKITDDDRKKIEELIVKEEYLLRKEKFLIKKEHEILEKEMDLNNKNEKLNKQKNQFYKEKKHIEPDIEYERKNNWKVNYERKQKQQKTKFKKIKNVNQDKRKENRVKSHKLSKEKLRQFVRNGHKYNATGDWYFKLNKGRSDIRKQEHASDWLFERSRIRTLRRNQANWYFQWMLSREKLRYK